MKKYLIFLLLLPAAFGSCVGTTPDLFDESASARIDGALNEYASLLRANRNGWVVEYYPEAGRTYGGYNLYFRFDDESNATVGFEMIPDSLASSLYSLKSDMGPTLNFDTYNPILHYFSDPGLPVGGGSGLGFEGDYEFVIVSGSASEFILKGKKTQNTIRMAPLPEGDTWLDYATRVNEIINASTVPGYKLVVTGNDEFKVSRSYNRFSISYEEIVDSEPVTVRLYAPFIHTPTGIRFYEPLELSGQRMQDFTFKPTEQLLDAEGADAQIILTRPPINETFSTTETQWFLTEVSPELQSYLDAAEAVIDAEEGEYIYFVFLGYVNVDDHTGHALVFGCTPDAATVYWAGYKMLFATVDGTEDQVTIAYDGTFRDGEYVTYAAAFEDTVSAFVSNSPYRLTPDYSQNPITIMCVSVNNPNFYFKLEQ